MKETCACKKKKKKELNPVDRRSVVKSAKNLYHPKNGISHSISHGSSIFLQVNAIKIHFSNLSTPG
jgi:hypothetical protein